MYPRSPREALIAQIAAEAALYGLTYEAFLFWLPYLRDAALPTPESYDLSGTSLSVSFPAWETAATGIVAYGAGLVYGHTLIEAARAIMEASIAAGKAMAVDAPGPRTTGGILAALDVDGEELAAAREAVPDDEMSRTARRVVADALGVTAEDVADLDARLRTVPTIRELQSRYLATVHNRMVGTPEEVFRDIAADVDKALAKGQSPLDMRALVQQHLSAETGDWPGRALTVARTEAAGAQSSATVAAALAQNEVLGEDLHKTWICTLDSKTRPSHFAADGQRVDLAADFDVGRAHLRFPGDPAGPPGEVINCRCAVGILAADEELPHERDRHTERGEGDSTVRNRDGSQADEIARRAEEGTIRAREDPDGIGRTASADLTATEEVAMADQDEATFRTFTDAVVALLGEPTDDGRMLAADIDLTFRSFPLPVMWVKQTGYGHENAYTVGVMESARVDGNRVVASGYLLNTSEADEAADQIGHGVTGPSVDLGAVDWMATDASGKEVTEDEYMDALDRGEDIDVYQTLTAATLMGVTLVSTPAFGNTTLTLDEGRSARDVSVAASITASADSPFVETVHKATMFADPGFTGPTPLRIDGDGRISGHLACYGTCHVGITDQCVTVPRSKTDYAHFHTSPPVLLEDGTRLAVGRLTVSTGHAGPRVGAKAAAEHYDNTGTCFALVRAGEDEHGVWVSGVAAPGVDADTLAAGLAAPLSGDWRTIGGNLELVAALAVNTPGFPIVASGATDEENRPLALVASLAPGRDVEAPAASSVDPDVLAENVVARMERRAEARALAHRVEERTAAYRRAEAQRIAATVGGK